MVASVGVVPPIPPFTFHTCVGWSGVANQAPTTPGCAYGVVADANSAYGDETGGAGVVDTYSCLSPVPPTPSYFIILETNFYILQEDGYKIYIQ